MGVKENITYTYTDDLTGEELEKSDLETVEFTYGGQAYKIDLGPDSATALDDFLAPYIDKAEKVTQKSSRAGAGGRKGDGKSRPGSSKWKEATYGKSGRLSAEQEAEWDALPEKEKKKYQD